MKKRLALGGLLFAVVAASASVVTTADALRTHVKFLAADALEGRLAGSPGERKAGDYAKRWFEQYGLQPAGVNGTFFQEFDLTVGYKPGLNSRFVIRKHGKDFPAGAGKDFNPLLFSANDEVAGDIVFVGYGLPGSRNKSVAGKIALVLSHPKTSFREVAKWMKQRGAVGVVFAGPSDIEGPLLPRICWQNAVSQDTKIAAAAVSPAYFKKLTGLDFEVTKKQVSKGFVPKTLASTAVSFRSLPEPNSVKGRNVLAILPGTDAHLKSEYIVIGAHIDHVGWGELGSMSGSAKIHNGADDNASGVSGVLELAKYFAQRKNNKRSLVFHLYSGEEEGLFGSNFFVRNPTIDVKAVSAMIDLDMIGGLNADKLIVDGVRSSPTWPTLLAQFVTGYKLQVDPAGEEALADRSDHGPWEVAGVPVLFFYTGEHARYHRETDDWQFVNYEGTARIVSTVAAVVGAIDGEPALLPFKKGNEIVNRSMQPQPSTGPGPTGRRVRVGLIPNYSDGGPGLLLDGVTPDSPAEKGGLKEGDRIVKWGDVAIKSIEDIQDIFAAAEPGKSVKVTVLRNGKEVELTIVPEPPN
jgi:hypothetical protein